MEFMDQMEALSLKTSELLDHIETEAATRSALIEPFIRILGYDPSNPLEVVPEFGANVDVPGNVQDKKVDYAILRDGKPAILIEVKFHQKRLESGFAQLYNYFTPTDARIGILTNGIIYQFYADLEKTNTMDKKPFLEIDICNLKKGSIGELKKLSKSDFNIDTALDAAAELKYTRGIKSILREQLKSESLDEEFVRFFFKKVCDSDKKFAGNLKDNFLQWTPKALQSFIREEIDNLINVAVGSTPVDVPESEPHEEPETESTSQESKIITTEEELESFYIVRAIISEVIDPIKVTYRDTQGYFGILLDDNNRKPICRFYANNPNNKRLELFDKGKDDTEKVSIEKTSDIYQYAEQIKATISLYDS